MTPTPDVVERMGVEPIPFGLKVRRTTPVLTLLSFVFWTLFHLLLRGAAGNRTQLALRRVFYRHTPVPAEQPLND